MKRSSFRPIRRQMTDALADKLTEQLKADVHPQMSDEDAFSFAVDEHDFLSFLLLVSLERLAEVFHLVVENVGMGHSRCRLKQLRGMKVNDERSVWVVFLVLWGM